MKIQLTYGLALAVASTVLMLVLSLLGFYSSPEKLSLAQMIGGLGGLAISATCIVLGQRARREMTPPHEAWTYGQAFGTGWKIVLFASLFGIVLNTLYFAFINTGFSELVVQAQVAKMEAQGRSSAQIEMAEKMARMMTRPAMLVVVGFINGLIVGTLISLLTAIFTKRAALPTASEPPVVRT